MSILPGQPGTGKDVVFDAVISDLSAALGLTDGVLIVLGQTKPKPEWVFQRGARWRVIELKAPSPLAAFGFVLWRLLTGKPATLSQTLFLSPGVVRRINRILSDAAVELTVFDTIRTFDEAIAPDRRRVVFLDDLFSERFAERAGQPRLRGEKVLGRYADAARFWSRLLSPAWAARTAMRVEARLCRLKERAVAKVASACVLLNENEQAELARRAGVSVHSYIPRLSAYAGGSASAGVDGKWLFVGALDYAPNAEAMIWFIDNVLPHYRRAGGLRPLRVIGRNCAPELASRLAVAGVEHVGFVEDLAKEYAGAAGVLIPIQSGSGVKIKALEAMSTGRWTVGTPRAYDGLGALPPNALSAEEPAAFARAMLDVETLDPAAEAETSSGWFEARFGPERLDRLRTIVADDGQVGA
ncbi:glycosyltransferase family 4 protein [Phenylobacterium sp.]|uniref:glycosyltransferase family 4 protein n=1 Tax=Phenylobacterium sp. TaxID=1871053 RepID=UPI0035AF5050